MASDLSQEWFSDIITHAGLAHEKGPSWKKMEAQSVQTHDLQATGEGKWQQLLHYWTHPPGPTSQEELDILSGEPLQGCSPFRKFVNWCAGFPFPQSQASQDGAPMNTQMPPMEEKLLQGRVGPFAY